MEAHATDPEGDPMTYTWEQTDHSWVQVLKSNLGTLTQGASFRSFLPTTSPVRYFPKFETVLSGNLKNLDDWEAAPEVARTMNFKATVRDNNPNPLQQQTAFGTQKVIVGDEGPFRITASKVYNNANGPITWDVVNTNLEPYNVANVKMDYSKDNGATWIPLTDSTPNDGVEEFQFPNLTTGSAIHLRVSAVGNVFYAIKKLNVDQIAACDGTAPIHLNASEITANTAKLTWDPIANATYILQYREQGTSTWIDKTTSTPSLILNGLIESTTYEYKVAAVCSGNTGTYSNVAVFTTNMLDYCNLYSTNFSEEFISNVTVTPKDGTPMSNNSGASAGYSNYTNVSSKVITLNKGSVGNTISVTKTWPGTKSNESITAWIDFNKNGVFESNEMIMKTTPNMTPTETVSFDVPTSAYAGPKPLRLRVALRYNTPQTEPCGSFGYGEVEDYAVMINSSLNNEEVVKSKEILLYPNPAEDFLHLTNVSSKANYTIYGLTGQVVSKGIVEDSKIKVSHLLKGVYMISIDHQGKTFKQKFIKK